MKLTGMIGKMGSAAALALPLLLGASGCHSYKYVDMTASFDQGSLDDTDILTIARCRIIVSGADSSNFLLEGCPNHAALDPHVIGPFEFSTFAESGTLKFEFQGFQGIMDKPECMIADGKQDVAVTSLTTIPATMTITKAGPGCANNVSPTGDGGP
jgi:hypothetical protein